MIQPSQVVIFGASGGVGSHTSERAIAKEIRRFSDDLTENLIREAKASERSIAHVHHAAEAMVTVAFNLGASSIDLPCEERLAVIERTIIEVRMIMRGAQAEADRLR